MGGIGREMVIEAFYIGNTRIVEKNVEVINWENKGDFQGVPPSFEPVFIKRRERFKSFQFNIAKMLFP